MYTSLMRRANEGDEIPNNNQYGYDISEPVAAIFVALFGLSTLLHLGQSIWSRRWYLIPSLVLGGIGEALGWSGRLWSSLNLETDTPFLIQISTTIIAPTFLAAANFIILGEIINRAGPQYSRMPARWYGLIFITIDVIALVIQAIGGGMASSASNTIGGDPATGGHVMLVGIVIQLVEILIYSVLAVEFFLNYKNRKVVRAHAVPQTLAMAGGENSHGTSSRGSENHTAVDVEKDYTNAQVVGGSGRMNLKEKLMSYGLAFSTLTLFIRAIYRVIELSDGWGGRIIHTQVYFNVLDATMIILSMYTLNILHPGTLLGRR